MFEWLDCFKSGDEDEITVVILNKEPEPEPIPKHIKVEKPKPILCNNKVPFKKKQVSWKNTPTIESTLSSEEYDRSVDWGLCQRNYDMYKRLKKSISGKHISNSLSNT